jgi:PAS domain S-box-containing protein
MASKQKKSVFFAVIVLLTVGAIVLDSFTPLGVADCVWYFIPLFLSIYVGDRFFSYALATVLSLLTIAGFYLSPAGIDPHLAFISRLVGIGVLWLMAILISQRKRVEEQLAEALDFNQKIISDAMAGILVYKASGQCELANEAAARILNTTVPELLKQNFKQIESWRVSGMLQMAEETLAGKPGHGEFHFTSTFGKEEWLDCQLNFFARGNEPHLFLLFNDISQRKLADEALARERSLLRTLVDNLPDCIYAKDASGRKILANPADLKNLHCKTEAEAIGKTDFDFFPREIAEKFWADDQKVIQGQPVINREEYFLNDAGEKRWLLTSKLPFRDQNGKITGLVGIGSDITERKLAEESVRESQALYHSLVEQLPIGVFRKDHEGRYVLANPFFCQTKGMKEEEFLGKTPQEVAAVQIAKQGATGPATKYAATGMKHHEQIMRTGRPIELIEEHVDAGGRKRLLHVMKFPVIGSDGKIIGTQGIQFDITERKQAEETIAHERRLLRTLIDLLPETFYIKDLDSRFLVANEALAKQLGKTDSSQILGLTDKDFFPPGLAAEFRAEELKVFSGEPLIGRKSICVFADGKEHTVLTSKLPFRDSQGRISGLVGIGHDISELKRAEEHVSEQAALLDKAQDAIMVMDLNDRFIYWNKSAERIYGWSAAEAIGKTPLNLFLGGVVSPQHTAAIKAVKEHGEWAGELQETTKDGKTITLQGRCNVIRDDQGNPKAQLVINTDITERKKLESQFLRSQRMESLGTMAGGIAHDLNNVLTPLLVSVQVLKEKTTDDDGKRLLESLEANVNRGASLVKQVLAFGRGVEGERIVVQPKHIAREIKQIVSETFPKSVQFELRSPADLWTITGDPTQLHQVLLNLCINARDAMPKGGKLSLQLENVTLDEAYASMNLEARRGPYLCITVNDTGTGIPKEIQEKIFDPFFTTKEPGKGTGLGLSTTLAIVKSHGGFIHCYSNPGKGSSFKVYLPANTTQAGPEKASTGEKKLPRGHNEGVLVVDDEEPIRKLAQRALERYGYHVLLASDGVEALSIYKLRRNEIDVVITDMVMPNMDGLATITALRSINPEIKIVGSSGMTSEGGVAKAMNAGIKHFVPKPYSAETMLNTLHEVLNSKH